MEKIPVGISACLLGDPVRYNHGHTQSMYCRKVLAEIFELRSFCPEVAIGLGTPRPSIRLTGDFHNPQVLNPDKPEQDHGPQLRNMAQFVNRQHPDLCGYIFMKDSPSCGVFRVKVYRDSDNIHKDMRAGVFAEQIMKKYPNLPVEEAGRLNDPALRENFILRVFAYRNWQSTVVQSLSARALINFHSRYKYTLMAQSQGTYRELGQLVAGVTNTTVERIAGQYFHIFMEAMDKPASRKNHCNTLMHILGYLKAEVEGEIRREILDVIEQYRRGEVHLVVPITLLQHYLKRFGSDYICNQAYLNPYPLKLGLRNAI